jgi:hemerythrin-like domain-containing protein
MSVSNKSLLTPAPDFSTPLELLHACHGRIEAQCETLLKLPGHLHQHGSDTQAQQAATAVLRYFSSAAQHHHEDEEQDMFPAIRQLATAQGRAQMLALLDNLIAQHRDMATAWGALAPWLEKIARGEAVDAGAMPVAPMVNLYRAHIRHEETELLPYCRSVLQSAQLAELGRRMAHRRGVAWDGTEI